MMAGSAGLIKLAHRNAAGTRAQLRPLPYALTSSVAAVSAETAAIHMGTAKDHGHRNGDRIRRLFM